MRTAFLFLLCCLSASATTYYVSNAGSDSNNGTSTGTPWQTIAHVNAQTFSPGDSILFNRGDTWREQLTIGSSGSSGNPITFGAYGSGAIPIITGADVLTGWTSASTNVFTHDNPAGQSGYITVIVDGTQFTQVSSAASVTSGTWFNDTTTTPNTIYVYISDNTPSSHTIEVSARQYSVYGTTNQYVTVENLALYGAGYAGIRLYGSQPSGYNQVKDVSAYYNRVMGIVFDGGQFHNSATDNNVHDNGNGIYANGSADYTTINNNNSYNNISYTITPTTDGDGVGVYTSNNVIVQNNVTHDNGGHGIDVDMETANVIDVCFNTTYHNGTGRDAYDVNFNGGTGTPDQNRVYYNVAYNNVNGTDYVIYGPADVFNNTSYLDGTVAVSESFLAVSGTIVMENNLAYIAGGVTWQLALQVFSGVTLTSNYNLWYNASGGNIVRNISTMKTFGGWQSLGYDVNSVNANPSFMSVPANLNITATSQARNRGLRIFGINQQISEGIPDIGAFEYAPGHLGTSSATKLNNRYKVATAN